MYGLRALLVGCQGQTLVDVRHELEKLSIEIEGQVRDVDVCVSLLAAQPSETRLLVALCQCRQTPTEAVERVVASVAGKPILILTDAAPTLARSGARPERRDDRVAVSAR